MRHEFYSRWLRGKKCPDGWLPLDAARCRHERRKPYAVVIGDSARPATVLELAGDFVRIALLDDHHREWMVGIYERRDGDRLFLSEATHQTFRGNSDAFALVETHHFREHGGVVIEERHFQTGVTAPRTFTMDVSRNWEDYPAFGDYESIVAMHWAAHLRGMDGGADLQARVR